MEKSRTNAQSNLYLAVSECVVGRRRRLSETVAVHSLIRESREVPAQEEVSETIGPRPSL